MRPALDAGPACTHQRPPEAAPQLTILWGARALDPEPGCGQQRRCRAVRKAQTQTGCPFVVKRLAAVQLTESQGEGLCFLK